MCIYFQHYLCIVQTDSIKKAGMQCGKQTTKLGAQLCACVAQRRADDNVGEQQTTSVLPSCSSVHGQASLKKKQQFICRERFRQTTNILKQINGMEDLLLVIFSYKSAKIRPVNEADLGFRRECSKLYTSPLFLYCS